MLAVLGENEAVTCTVRAYNTNKDGQYVTMLGYAASCRPGAGSWIGVVVFHGWPAPRMTFVLAWKVGCKEFVLPQTNGRKALVLFKGTSFLPRHTGNLRC